MIDLFHLMKDLFHLMLYDMPKQSLVEDLMNDLGFVAQTYRLLWENEPKNYLVRVEYIIIIHMLSLISLFEREDSLDGSTTDSYTTDIYSNKTWKNELEIAVLDYPFKEYFLNHYNTVLECIGYEDNKIGCLLNSGELFSTSIKFLRQTEKITDEHILYNGNNVLDVISFHKSRDIVKILIQAISK